MLLVAGELMLISHSNSPVWCPGPPATSVSPDLTTVCLGCQTSFTCLDGDSPPQNFRWLRDNTVLQNSDTVTTLPSGGLLLSDVRLSGAGVYTCEIFGTYKSTNATTVLIVEDQFNTSLGPPSKPVIFSPTPSVQSVTVGSTVQFVCPVGGVPDPDIMWFRNGMSVEGLDNVEVLLDQSLTVTNTGREDEGNYTCVAFNSVGSVAEEFHLVVAGEGQRSVYVKG